MSAAEDESALRLPWAPFGTTVAVTRRHVADLFRAENIETPELDARVLVGHALGLDHAGLASAASRPLNGGEANTIAMLARRRLAHEPVARIVGEREFWGLRLRIGPATLVPRPETETLVEAVLATCDASGGRAAPLHIADIGTGSGAIALALLGEMPCAQAVGTDIEACALAVARGNASRLGCSARLHLVACDLGAALAGPFDVVVSNPPYIRSGDIAALAPEVREHDPPAALDGGPDGLAFYRAIAGDLRRLLKPRGRFAAEIGAGMAEAVAAILTNAGLAVRGCRRDLSGLDRVILAEWPG